MSVRWPAQLFFLCLLLTGAILAKAQDDARGIAYYNRISTGILAGGQNGLVTGSVSTTQGIDWRRWSLGVGVGVESYERWRAVPVFGSLSYYFRGAREKGVFLQVNAGHSFCRLLDPGQGLERGKTEDGPMISPVIGYQIAAGKILVNISAGYKTQKLSGTYSSPWTPLLYTINEQADRFVFQIGVGF